MRFLNLYAAVFGWRVQAGPFRGLRYVRDSVCSTLAPKLLGSYETELRDWIETALNDPPRTLLNIGAAEGYYAVGFARRCPELQVVAYEAGAPGRVLLAELARRNGVAGRVQIEGACTPEILGRRLAAAAAFLLVDIEGGEIDLLDPVRLPALRSCPMLIELHEDHQPAADILRSRFAKSHDIAERWTRPRTWRDLPQPLRTLARLTGSRRLLNAMSEARPGPMRWFRCTPRPALSA